MTTAQIAGTFERVAELLAPGPDTVATPGARAAESLHAWQATREPAWRSRIELRAFSGDGQ